MEETGIEKKLQDSILDPESADVCGTRSLEHWVRETLLDNLLVVKGMEEGAWADCGEDKGEGVGR